MTIWQILAVPVCGLIWVFVAAANLHAAAMLAGDGILLSAGDYTVMTKHAYMALSVGFDAVLCISTIAVFWQFERRHWGRMIFGIIVWAICAIASWHSMWVFIGANQGGAVAVSSQSRDVYAATKLQLDDAQKRYSWLAQTATTRMGPKTLREHRQSLQAAEDRLDELRKQLASTKVTVAATPIKRFDIIGATFILIVNTLCWPAIFGPRRNMVAGSEGNVAGRGTALVEGPPPSLPEPVGGRQKPNRIIAATVVVPPVTTPPPSPAPEEQVTGASTPSLSPAPRDEVTPVPGPDDSPTPPGTNSNVVVLGDSRSTAVKRWARQRTVRDPGAFSKSSELFEDYLQHGTMEMTPDEFFKAMSSEFGGPARKKVGRGYRGVAIKASDKKAAATT